MNFDQVNSQEWETVTLKKKNPKNKEEALKQGVSTEIVNKNKLSDSQNMSRKLEEATDVEKIPKVSKEVSQIIQKARLSQKLTQKQLAQSLNVLPEVISKIESGKEYNTYETKKMVNKIATKLSVKLPKIKF